MTTYNVCLATVTGIADRYALVLTMTKKIHSVIAILLLTAADPRQMEGPVEPALSLSNVSCPHSDWLSLRPVRTVLANGRKVRAKRRLLNRLRNRARRIVSGLRSIGNSLQCVFFVCRAWFNLFLFAVTMTSESLLNVLLKSFPSSPPRAGKSACHIDELRISEWPYHGRNRAFRLARVIPRENREHCRCSVGLFHRGGARYPADRFNASLSWRTFS